MGSRKTLTEAEKDDVVRRYLKLGQSQNVIAFALGSSQPTISKVLHQRGVTMRASQRGHFRRHFTLGVGGAAR